MVNDNFHNLHYVTVKIKSFETIKIDKKDNKTEKVKNNCTNYLYL